MHPPIKTAKNKKRESVREGKRAGEKERVREKEREEESGKNCRFCFRFNVLNILWFSINSIIYLHLHTHTHRLNVS